MKYLLLICCLMIGMIAKSQVCNGSLGDPTAVINFGAGLGIGPSLSSNNTSYTYNGADCPNDGTYVINSKTSKCFDDTWHSLGEDHTLKDVNGYMMIVNADLNAGIFYTFSVENLCPNTTYQFSSFIINLIKPSAPCSPKTKPKITFRVETEDGTLINTYSTGFINESPFPKWTEYGFFFKSPPNVSKVILKLINDSGGGCGNDLAIDDITFRPCGPNIMAGSIGTTAQNIFEICEGKSRNYSFEASISSGYQNPAFQWQIDKRNGDGWLDISNSNNKTLNISIIEADPKGYSYRLASAEQENIQSTKCRVYSNVIEINVADNLDINAGSDIFLLENQTSKIMAKAPPNLTYKWIPSTYLDDPNILNPIVKPMQTTVYTLSVVDNSTGCEAMDEITVYVEEDLSIPDTFSPNGDGTNDSWEIKGLIGFSNAEVSIFNRDGKKIYQSYGYTSPWNGKFMNKELPTGVYYYIIDTKSDVRPIYRGSILIIK